MHVELHGGPHAMQHLGFSPWCSRWPQPATSVLLNPRGPTGYGSDFGAARGTRYPCTSHPTGGDRRRHEVTTRGWADMARFFSLGGCGWWWMLASWVVGRSTRFAAASVRCPANDWLAAPSPVARGRTVLLLTAVAAGPGSTAVSARRRTSSVGAPPCWWSQAIAAAHLFDEGGEWFTAL